MKAIFEGIVDTLPPDKSISHRAALIGAIAKGETRIQNFSPGADNQTTLSALAQLGVKIQRSENNPNHVVIYSDGLFTLKKSLDPIQCNNSGSTMRLLSGILSAHPFQSTLVGDNSLMNRPMRRIAEPLSLMGATFSLSTSSTPPIHIEGKSPLKAINYITPIASAQVKSSLIFAALHAEGISNITETVQTRNHTEVMLGLINENSNDIALTTTVQGLKEIIAKDFYIPGDASSSCFLVALGILAKSKELAIKQVGLNPTRTGFLKVLQTHGAVIQKENLRRIGGELIGDLILSNTSLNSPLVIVEPSIVANVIDEIPMLAVLSVLTTDTFEVRNAEELRSKECDRIKAMVINLRMLGFHVEEFFDGFVVKGKQQEQNQFVDILTFHDHRIAMSFSIANFFCKSELRLDNHSSVAVSFPNFFEIIRELQFK